MSDIPPQSTQPVLKETHSLDELRTSGLLWLINKSLLHPRGYAIALAYDTKGVCVGWQLHGNGTEPYAFLHEDDMQMFPIVEALLNSARANG